MPASRKWIALLPASHHHLKELESTTSTGVLGDLSAPSHTLMSAVWTLGWEPSQPRPVSWIAKPPDNRSVLFEQLRLWSFVMQLPLWLVQLVKNPPPMPKTWVRSLGCEDPLKKGKATHSTILAWRIWTQLSNFHSQESNTKTYQQYLEPTSIVSCE